MFGKNLKGLCGATAILSLSAVTCALAADTVQAAHELNKTAIEKIHALQYKEACVDAEKAEKLLSDVVKKTDNSNVRYEYDDSLSWEIISNAALGNEPKAIEAIKKINHKPISDCAVNIQLSGAYAQVGETEFLAGKKDTATKFLEKSISVYRKWQNHPDGGYSGSKVLQVPNAPTCSAMIRLGEIYIKDGKQAEGTKLVAEGKEWLRVKGLIK